MMTYRGFVGVAEIDIEAGILSGEVINTRSVITFESDTVAGLREEFEKSVDVYLEVCKEKGIAPERPVAGNIYVRTNPDIHRAAIAAAASRGMTLNSYLSDLIEKGVATPSNSVMLPLRQIEGGMTTQHVEPASPPPKASNTSHSVHSDKAAEKTVHGGRTPRVKIKEKR